MYVITYYSFKGGVGRTMALVNTAVELAQSGRRVLIVDFDLEAPGIDAVDLPKPKDPTPGVVEYVTEYLQTNVAPDVNNFVYEAIGVPKRGGKLWIMPAGKLDDSYGVRLSEIRWRDLYSKHDGYLMFEDLKAQWKDSFDPDYVLIDSRTGHTDVGGICTRHLPDAVVLLFFPNQQNLRGLKKVVQDVRAEAQGSRKKSIDLHFVLSNVGDLDDEDRILEMMLRSFREELGYDQLLQTVHHYSSLSLLNQTIFTKDRPRSRLAREYQALTEKLIEHNPEDRAAALRFLDELLAPEDSPRRRPSTEVYETRLTRIRENHLHDSDVMFRLAVLRQHEGRIEDALSLLDELVKTGKATAKILLRRAECKHLTNDRSGASADLLDALKLPELTTLEVSKALRLLRQVDPEALSSNIIVASARRLDVPGKLRVAKTLQWNREGMRAACAILNEAISEGSADATHTNQARADLGLCMIGLGDFQGAMKVLAHGGRPDPANADQYLAFNYAMAEWATTGTPPRDLMERVCALVDEEHADANYCQCLAIAFWASGDVEKALEFCNKAMQMMMTRPSAEFSCWRYLVVSPIEFLQDLEFIQHMIKGANIQPAFLHAPQTSEAKGAR